MRHNPFPYLAKLWLSQVDICCSGADFSLSLNPSIAVHLVLCDSRALYRSDLNSFMCRRGEYYHQCRLGTTSVHAPYNSPCSTQGIEPTMVSCATCWWFPKVLEAIGAKTCSNTTKTNCPGINYQDSVSVPVSEQADNDAATWEGDNRVDIVCKDPEASADLEFILPIVDKVSASQSCYWIPFCLGS